MPTAPTAEPESAASLVPPVLDDPWQVGETTSLVGGIEAVLHPDATDDAVAHHKTALVPPPSRWGWLRRYQAGLLAADLGAAVIASVVAVSVRFGSLLDSVPAPRPSTVLMVVLPFLWVALLAGNRAYDSRFVGVGRTEFQRLFRAFLHLTALTTFFSYAAKVQISRELMLFALPMTLLLTAIGRGALRRVLRRWRAAGKAIRPVVAIGAAPAIAVFAAQVDTDPRAGARVVGGCIPPESAAADDALTLAAAGVELYGDVAVVTDSVRASGATTVVVLAGMMGPEALRRLSWQLEGTDADLIVSAGLTDVADRRLHVQPIGGVSLLCVEGPRFTGAQRLAKGLFDRLMAGCVLLLLAPVMLAIAMLVRLSSRGPVLFLQTRIGKGGKPFRMIKFRSMCVDAEQRVTDLVSINDGAGLLFKLRHDPRVTRVGRALRRFSLDELPQLCNVLAGSMSLVGPRPPLPAEVALYEEDVRRRLLVKPGLTGVWQVSGRSNLTWEESVHLDLRYVENWSLGLDMAILAKTVGAVVRADGAY